MSEATEIREQTAQLEDAGLQKRFGALFDEGQGENARDALVSYCRSRGYHPAEMKILCGNNLFQRLERMLHRQNKLINEYRTTNRWLMDQAHRLNGGKAVIPPKPESLQQAAVFQRLMRQKFGMSRGARSLACQTLGVSATQLARFERGVDVTDTLIEQLELLSDWNSEFVVKRKVGKSKIQPGNDTRLKELEKRFRHIPKPRKHQKEHSDMPIDEFIAIGQEWFGEKTWIEPMARFIGFNKDHVKMLVDGDKSRHLTAGTGEYIRLIKAELNNTGGFVGAVLPKPAKRIHTRTAE